jgi:hypothetical protein
MKLLQTRLLLLQLEMPLMPTHSLRVRALRDLPTLLTLAIGTVDDGYFGPKGLEFGFR